MDHGLRTRKICLVQIQSSWVRLFFWKMFYQVNSFTRDFLKVWQYIWAVKSQSSSPIIHPKYLWKAILVILVGVIFGDFGGNICIKNYPRVNTVSFLYFGHFRQPHASLQRCDTTFKALNNFNQLKDNSNTMLLLTYLILHLICFSSFAVVSASPPTHLLVHTVHTCMYDSNLLLRYVSLLEHHTLVVAQCLLRHNNRKYVFWIYLLFYFVCLQSADWIQADRCNSPIP